MGYFFQNSNIPLSSTLRLITLGKRSVFKLIWSDFLLFIIVYILISLTYRYILIPYSPEARQTFELICIYSEIILSNGKTLVTFLTGFYVTQVVNRWWNQFMALPWPDRLALKMANFIPGQVCTIDFKIQ